MSATIIDGKAFAAGLRGRVGKAVASLKDNHGLTPGLAVVLVGEDPASAVYVNSKRTQTKEAGMLSVEHTLPADTAEADLLKLVEELNADPAVHGILVQFPVPDHISQQRVIDTIDPMKDVKFYISDGRNRKMEYKVYNDDVSIAIILFIFTLLLRLKSFCYLHHL